MSKKNYVLQTKKMYSCVEIFIPVPQNKFVFDNISSMLHCVIIKHFKRIGYSVVNNENKGFKLSINIKEISPRYNFVSPDVLLFHSFIKLELLGQLCNSKGKKITEKVFSFSSLLSKARNPVMNTHFASFEFQKLINKAVPKIELYFRDYMIKRDVIYGI